jgi:hypothetical protein
MKESTRRGAKLTALLMGALTGSIEKVVIKVAEKTAKGSKPDKYMVTSTGVKDGNAYSSLTRIVQGVKESGDKYAFLDGKSQPIRESEELVIGAIYEYATARVSPKADNPTQK